MAGRKEIIVNKYGITLKGRDKRRFSFDFSYSLSMLPSRRTLTEYPAKLLEIPYFSCHDRISFANRLNSVAPLPVGS